jgi:hypothetical protein
MMAVVFRKEYMTQFQVEVNNALQLGLTDLVREFYLLETNGYIDQNLHITLVNGMDIELLERIVRFYCKVRFYLDKDFDTITIFGITNSQVEFIRWFIKFFYYLESMELAELNPNHSCYRSNKEVKSVFNSEFANYQIDISNKRFIFNSVNVVVFPIVN